MTGFAASSPITVPPFPLPQIPKKEHIYETPAFSLNTSNPTMWDTAKTILLVVAKIVIFPWGAYELVKYAMQRVIMAFVYERNSRAHHQ
jgi:hypothetical protein